MTKKIYLIAIVMSIIAIITCIGLIANAEDDLKTNNTLVVSFGKDIVDLGALGITISYNGDKCQPILEDDSDSWAVLNKRGSAGYIKYGLFKDFSGEGTLFGVSGDEKTHQIKIGFVSAYGSAFSQENFIEIDLMTSEYISIEDFNIIKSESEALSNRGDQINTSILISLKGQDKIITSQKITVLDINGLEDEGCVGEGGSLGAVILDNNKECCPGLIPYIPFGIDGTRGICQKLNYCETDKDCRKLNCVDPICSTSLSSVYSGGKGECICGDACVGEGGSLGAVIPGNNKKCCLGLEPYILIGSNGLPLLGTRGICRNKQSDGHNSSNGVICDYRYQPVCGVDGNVYANKCIAEQQNNINIAYEGLCNIDEHVDGIKSNAKLLTGSEINKILESISEIRDVAKEQQTQIKYLAELKKDVAQLSQTVENALNNFITYGVDENTKRLGAGERAAVIYSFKSAFKKLPETEDELADAIKIANGRWPSLRSDDSEKQAKEQFQKIYKKIADMDNPNDNAAITVMAYGLRQKAENRNLDSEKQGIKTFQHIYGYHPNTTEDWNTMQAITYSGASRGMDTDGDLLLDEREAELGTDPNNPDTDGDGYSDGEEVANGFDPMK